MIQPYQLEGTHCLFRARGGAGGGAGGGWSLGLLGLSTGHDTSVTW